MARQPIQRRPAPMAVAATAARLRAELEAVVRHLARDRAALGLRRASARRPSGSPQRLRELGCGARVEEERAHGTYWWPLGAAQRGAGRRSPALPRGAAAAARGAAGRVRRRRHRRRHQRRAPVVPPPLPARARRPGTSSPRPATATRRAARSCSSPTTTPRTAALLFHPGVAPRHRRPLPRPARAQRHHPAADVRRSSAGPLLVALGALAGRRGAAQRRRPCSRSARAAAFADIGSRAVGARRQRQPHRRRDARSASRGALARGAGRGPARAAGLHRLARSRSWRACRPSPAATSPRCRTTARTSSASTRSARPSSSLLEGEGMLVMRDYPTSFKDLLAQLRARRGRRTAPRPALPQRHRRR